MKVKRSMSLLLCWTLLLSLVAPAVGWKTPSAEASSSVIYFDDFDGATSANLFTAGYMSLPEDPEKPMYIKTGGTVQAEGGVLTLSSGRMTIGALSNENTTSSSTPGGVFDLSQPYEILIDIDSVGGSDTSKKFQVYVDNNTTGQANSLHGGHSKIFEKVINTIEPGMVKIESDVGTATSFIQIRTESNSSVSIKSIMIRYQGSGEPGDDPGEEPEEPGGEDPGEPGEPGEPGSGDPGEPGEPGGEDPEPEDPGDPGDDPGEPGEPPSGPIFLDEFEGVTDLFSASYRSLPGDPSKPMYHRGGGNVIVNPAEDTVTLNAGRMTIGALTTSSTSSDDEPPLGVFDLSKPYQIIINLTHASGDAGKKFQVYVDNSTTSQGNSMHGNASRIYNENVDSITDYRVVIESTVGTSASFIQVRTESGASVTIDSIAIIYQGDSDPTVPVPPDVPTGLAAEAGDEQVILTWEAGRKVVGYKVRIWSDDDPVGTMYDTHTNSLTLTGLTNGVSYYFAVEAYNVAGTSGESAPVTATPQEGLPPDQPTGLIAVAGDALITLRWDAMANADGYRVYRWDPELESYVLVADVDRNMYAVTGLDNGSTYFFAIEAYNKRGSSPRTGHVSATPDAALTSKPLGFASLGNDGKGTTGGEGGSEVIVTTAEELNAIMRAREKAKSTDPITIYVSGKLTFSDSMLDVKDTHNISLIGLGSDAVISGFGLKIVRTSNIIVQNITFEKAKDDSIEVASSHNIWIDHNTFLDGYDGLLDIKEGSYHVTVSWNHFKEHRKTSLVGHSDNNGDTDRNLKVTYHHNFFDGTYSRNPRVRFGQVHVVNNYYLNTGAVIDGGGYGIGAAAESQIVAEGNYFENVKMPIIVGWADWKDSPIGNKPGYVKHENNVYENSGEPHSNESGLTFHPADYYAFPVEDPNKIPQLVLKYAGAGRASKPGDDEEPGGPGNEDPDTGDPGVEDPDEEDPDTGDPGVEDPDEEDPDTGDPGVEDPDEEDPDTGDPGVEDPDEEDPDTEDPDNTGGSSPPPSSGTGSVPTPSRDVERVTVGDQGVVIILDQELNEEDGKTTATNMVSASLLREALELLAEDEAGQSRILVEAEDEGQTETTFVLPMGVIQEVVESGSDALLSMAVGDVRYDLLFSALDIQAIAGTFIRPEHAEIRISIADVTDQVNEQIRSEIEGAGSGRVTAIYEFTIQIADRGISFEWEEFNTYVLRTIEFSADEAAIDRLTVVSYDEARGEWVFVPALFVRNGDQVEAIIKRNSNSIYTIIEHQATFADIDGHWAQSEIELLASKQILSGADEDLFNPDQLITRAEFANFLVRALGLKEQAGDRFADVGEDVWFAGAVNTAAYYSLVNGISDSRFDPHANITREQMVVMLSRAMELAGLDTVTDLSALNRFADRDQISFWAVEHSAKAVAAGIVQGKAADKFAPQDNVTRAEAAVMLLRFLRSVEFINL